MAEKLPGPEVSDEHLQILHLLIDSLLISADAPARIPDIPSPEDKSWQAKHQRGIENERERAERTTEDKLSAIHGLAEQIYLTYRTGLEPDEQYLKGIAELAADYFHPDWHETAADNYQWDLKRKRWEEGKEQRITTLIEDLRSRSVN
ncbi:MAG: hypothetical protein Q8P77_04055 [Candidatus Veblenbacteria bacterium]|nr:hypothetical protein [Candidatus Veblenbacteria bacterium]